VKQIIKKPHTFFFSLIPIFIIVGLIKTGNVIDVTIYDTFFAVKTEHWCYFSALFVGLIGLSYYMLYWAKKPTVQILSLFHILFQFAALVLFLFCVFFLNTKNIFTSNMFYNSVDFYAILSASYLLFVISISMHVLNFILTLFKKSN
jgi:hypothetical protein